MEVGCFSQLIDIVSGVQVVSDFINDSPGNRFYTPFGRKFRCTRVYVSRKRGVWLVGYVESVIEGVNDT